MKPPIEASAQFARHFLGILVAILIVHGTPSPVHAQTPQLTLVNGDEIPFPDRLVFSRIGGLDDPPASNGVHDVGMLRIENTGSDALDIQSLVVEGPFVLENPPSLPLVVSPGGALELTIRFAAESGDLGVRGLHSGSLMIGSNDGNSPATVDLVGYWQTTSEGGTEAELSDIVEKIFGYSTRIAFPDESIEGQGVIETIGDEVLSPYWQMADPLTPVLVRPLASFYRCCTNSINLSWFTRGAPDAPEPIVTIKGSDTQTVLPRTEAGESEASFTPGAETVFGFGVEDTVWTDPMLNDVSLDDCSGGRATCGHRVRFWPAKDAAGIPIPNTYIMAVELSTHWDHNDAVYLVSNVTPSKSTVGVEDKHAAEIPSSFALESYPNPFNPSTIIRYTLPAFLDVHLDVYDGAGRHVATLVEEGQPAGQHEVVFDAVGLTSGIYVCRLSAGNRSETHALLLIR